MHALTHSYTFTHTTTQTRVHTQGYEHSQMHTHTFIYKHTHNTHTLSYALIHYDTHTHTETVHSHTVSLPADTSQGHTSRHLLMLFPCLVHLSCPHSAQLTSTLPPRLTESGTSCEKIPRDGRPFSDSLYPPAQLLVQPHSLGRNDLFVTLLEAKADFSLIT